MLLLLFLAIFSGQEAGAQLSPWEQGFHTGYTAMEEQRYEDAERWFQNALREVEGLPLADGRLGRVLDALGTLYRAWSPARGEVFFRDCGRRWEKENPDDPRLAPLLNAYAGLLHREPVDAEGYARVAPLYQRALEIEEAAHGKEAPRLVGILERLGWYATQTARDEARVHYQRAIDIVVAAGQQKTGTAATLHYALAGVHWEAGRHAEAAQSWQCALEIYTQLDPDGAQTAYTLNRLAWAYERLGDYPRVTACWERAAAIREKLDPTGWELLQVLNDLANAQRLLGRLTDAEQTCRQMLAIRKQAQPGSEDIALITLADILFRQGRTEEAKALYAGVADPFRLRLHPAPARFRMLACLGLGQCALAAGDREAAMPWLIRVQELLDNTFGTGDDETAITLRLALREYDTAAELCSSLLEADARPYPPDHPRVADHLALLAQAQAGMGEGEKAKESIIKESAMWDKTFGADHPALISRLLAAADIYQACGMKGEAAACLVRAEGIAGKADLVDGLLALARYYRQTGNAEKVKHYYEQAGIAAKQYPADSPVFQSLNRQIQAIVNGE
ncbi:MAG: tetratricopeptide repeat protein [Armatimonadota bacterium]